MNGAGGSGRRYFDFPNVRTSAQSRADIPCPPWRHSLLKEMRISSDDPCTRERASRVLGACPLRLRLPSLASRSTVSTFLHEVFGLAYGLTGRSCIFGHRDHRGREKTCGYCHFANRTNTCSFARAPSIYPRTGSLQDRLPVFSATLLRATAHQSKAKRSLSGYVTGQLTAPCYAQPQTSHADIESLNCRRPRPLRSNSATKGGKQRATRFPSLADCTAHFSARRANK